jgi:hypothetical protein
LFVAARQITNEEKAYKMVVDNIWKVSADGYVSYIIYLR